MMVEVVEITVHSRYLQELSNYLGVKIAQMRKDTRLTFRVNSTQKREIEAVDRIPGIQRGQEIRTREQGRVFCT